MSATNQAPAAVEGSPRDPLTGHYRPAICLTQLTGLAAPGYPYVNARSDWFTPCNLYSEPPVDKSLAESQA